MSVRRDAAIRVVAGLVVCVGFAATAMAVDEPGDETTRAENARVSWTEVQWPFLTDEWGGGRAFTCKASDCGGELSLYLRAKVGFCNCATGVTEDEDLDRVGDLTLLSNRFVPLAAGHQVAVGGLSGRSRPYDISLPLARRQTAIAIALHVNCDAVVATVVTDRDHLAAAEQSALAFLGGATVQQWARTALGS